MKKHVLESFAYGYRCPPSPQQLRTGSATLVQRGTLVTLVRTEGAYSVMRMADLLLPVLSAELRELP